MTAVHQAAKGLPIILKPVEDELLSSWITRHAVFYCISPRAMLRHCLSDAVSLRAADLRLNAEPATRIGHIFHSPAADIRRMTHADVPESAERLLAPKPVQICLACSQENARTGTAAARLRRRPKTIAPCSAGFPERNPLISRCSERARPDSPVFGRLLKSSLEGWRITCPVCGSELVQLDARGEPCPLEDPVPFANIWGIGLRGQSLFENAIVHNNWPWASPIHILRLLLVRRLCNRADRDEGIEHGRTANLIIPRFDETVRRLGLEARQGGGRLIIPLSVSSALLAAVSIVINEGREAVTTLSTATIGGYRLQFDKIVAQMRPEIRLRQTVSQLLQL